MGSPGLGVGFYVFAGLFGFAVLFLLSLLVFGGGWIAVVFAQLPFAGQSAKLKRSVSLAVKSLWLHKLRSFLSVLGIIIGTSAVISLMAFGEGSMQDALDDIKRQGATNIIVRSVKPPDDSATASKGFVTTYGLVRDDLERFSTLTTNGDVTRIVPMRVFPSEARYLDRLINARVIGTVPDYQAVNKLELSRGRFLIENDDSDLENFCVLGSEAADRLFPFEDPLGQTVGMRNHFFKVVGILKERMPTGGTGGSQAAEDYNRDIYIPIRTSRRRFGEIISVRTAGVAHEREGRVQPGDADRERGGGHAGGPRQGAGGRQRDQGDAGEEAPEEGLAVTVPLDRLEEAERAQNRFTTLLALIASISLFVGGIGIMNIMLATVTERTREIGIRRALGAKQKDITLQFLVEAVVQTTIGGLCGAIIGVGSVYLLPALWSLVLQWGWFTGQPLPAKIHVPSIFLSLTVSIGVGVLFGWYPARRAAKLDPIEALRHV